MFSASVATTIILKALHSSRYKVIECAWKVQWSNCVSDKPAALWA